MPFELDSEIGAALHALTGGQLPPVLPVGEIKGRREVLDGLVSMVAQVTGDYKDVEMRDFRTQAEDGHEITCRWYTKKHAPLPGSAVVYTHGGGYICANITQWDCIVKRYVSRTGVPFMSIEYRLCPEVKAPVPVTDVYAGLKYLVDHAQDLGVDVRRIAIMGDSAGGGITASLAHYIKLKGGPVVKKQILVYPMLDDRTVEVDEDIAPFLTWAVDDNKTAWAAVLGDKMGKDGVDPIEAAGRTTVSDARGLPPAYIDVGELDIFRNEDIEYAQTLGKAGVSCELHVFPSVPHVFQDFAPDTEVSRQALESRYKAIKSI